MPPRKSLKATKKPPALDPSPLPANPGPTEIVPPGTGPGTDPGPGAVGDVERAVQAINALYTIGALDTALEIGDYVLRTYLGGDAARFALGEAEPSLRELADHPGLGFPKTTLWTALAVHRQYPALPGDARRRLSFTHHRLLLAVTSVRAKAQLATEAAARRWTTRILEDAVERWRLGHHLPPLGGTPEHPALTASKRAANAALRAAQEIEEGAPPTAAERQEIARQARLTAKRLERLMKALAAAAKKPRRGS